MVSTLDSESIDPIWVLGGICRRGLSRFLRSLGPERDQWRPFNVFNDCLWCPSPLGFSGTKCLKLVFLWQWGKTEDFSAFRLVAPPDIIWKNMMEHLSSFPVVNILVPTNLISSVYCFSDYTRSRTDVYIDLFSKVISQTPWELKKKDVKVNYK